MSNALQKVEKAEPQFVTLSGLEVAPENKDTLIAFGESQVW